jgi:hypothetical protein
VQDRKDPIDNHPPAMFPGSPGAHFLGQVLHYDLPFGIIQISRVSLFWFGHQASLPDYFLFAQFSDAF